MPYPAPELYPSPNLYPGRSHKATPQLQFAEELYARLEPWHLEDAKRGYPLRLYVRTIAEMFRQVETYAREDRLDNPAWSILLDVDRCPPEALYWLAYFAGVRLPSGASVTEQRQLIRDQVGQRRGTYQSIADAIERNMTLPLYQILERVSGNAYRLRVVARTSEVPDEEALRQAILAVKPAGIVLELVLAEGQTWDEAVGLWDDGNVSWDDTATETV